MVPLPSCTGSTRVVFEPAARVLRLSCFTETQKGIIATVVAEGVWTRDRLRAAGYVAPLVCELCGATSGEADSL